MRNVIGLLIVTALMISCSETNKNEPAASNKLPIAGTWKLLSGTLIEKGDTTVTDYTKNISFIKIINGDHFAFLSHDVTDKSDSANFSAGGGRYTLNDSSYTEHLEYCNAREWEGHDFTFTVTIKNDTLMQQGIEKIDSAGINRLNIEKYVRMEN